MADLNDDDSDSPMADDLLLDEIISRLYLKQTIQCSLLNKNLRHQISQPQFQRRLLGATAIFRCSAFSPKIFTRIPSEIVSPGSTISPASLTCTVTLERETSILASCNGLLLLHMKPYSNKYHVFNPITAEIMSFDYPVNVNDVGLAVDVADSPFNLVAPQLKREPDRTTVVIFRVFAPGPAGRSMCLRSEVRFIAPRSFTLAADGNVRPVYAAGSLYWLGDYGRVMLEFDVEKQQGRVSNGPLYRSDQSGDNWFGPVGGSVRFVHASQREIVIYGHDRVKGAWRVDHRIGNISSYSNNDYLYGQLVYFDGGRLFFLVRKYGEDAYLHIYNVLRQKWEKKTYVFSTWSWCDSRQDFFSFFPTTAKVSDFYLKDLKKMEEEEKEMMKKKNAYYYNNYMHEHDTLLGLHRLLSPTAK